MSLSCRASGKDAPGGGRKRHHGKEAPEGGRKRRHGKAPKTSEELDNEMVHYWASKAP
jgi:hypothetical protein